MGLTYNATLTMNRGAVQWNRQKGEGVIPLPEGATQNRTFNGDVYRVDGKLFQLLPRNDSVLGGRRRLRRGAPRAGSLGSCALVGNSGSLLYRQYGKEIDAHDVVYRFNQAPSESWEQHVGARTTHESLNSAWIKEMLERGHRRGNRWNWRKHDTSLVIPPLSPFPCVFPRLRPSRVRCRRPPGGAEMFTGRLVHGCLKVRLGAGKLGGAADR